MTTKIKQFLIDAHNAGMPKNQVINFRKGSYAPQPKQMEFHAACRECDQEDGPTEIGFGGARGPGKSHATLAQIALDDCQRRPHLKTLLLRKVGKAVRESFEDQRQKVLRVPHKYNRSSGVVTFNNGSKIVLGHFQNESDIDSYLGLEYDVIAIEEATTLTETKYKAIRTCSRTGRDDWRPRIYSNTNPGGVGHNWYKQRFIMPWRNNNQIRTRFIPATVYDNKFVNETYTETLEDLTGWKQDAWLRGSWDIAVGQYFTTFSFDEHVVEPFAIPDHWPKKWMGLDYGWTHPTAATIMAQNHEGVLYVVADYAMAKELPSTHIKNLKGLLGDLNIQNLYTVVGGGDMWQSDHEGNVVADDYMNAFPKLERANMDRIGGATRILKLLGNGDLKFFNTANRTYNQLAAMQHDPNRPEDVLKVNAKEGLGGDDLYDALRYSIMAVETEQEVEVFTINY